MLDQSIIDKLHKADYKMTQQREAVLEVTRERRGEHLSAEEVLNAARQKVPNLGIATVYRTLERLVALGILYKTSFNEGKYRYELADPSEHQHHHIICIGCGKIFDVEEGLLDGMEEHLEKQGFEIINHQVKIWAYCADCKSKQA